MTVSRLRAAALIAVTSATLASCSAYDGYGGIGLGYGGGYYDDYYGGYYDNPYYGWYDNYYYPGAGYYVYDQRGGRHAWNDRQRSYWEGRRSHIRDRTVFRENWSGYRGERHDGRYDGQRGGHYGGVDNPRGYGRGDYARPDNGQRAHGYPGNPGWQGHYGQNPGQNIGAPSNAGRPEAWHGNNGARPEARGVNRGGAQGGNRGGGRMGNGPRVGRP